MTTFFVPGMLAHDDDEAPDGCVRLTLAPTLRADMLAQVVDDDDGTDTCTRLCDALLSDWATRLTRDDVLVGYSLGGRLALHAVARGLRVGGLVVVSAHAGLDGDDARRARARLDAHRAAMLVQQPDAFLRTWHDEPVFAHARGHPAWQAQQRRRHAALCGPDAALRRAWARAFRAWSPGVLPSSTALLSRLDVPCLWLCGARDDAYVQRSLDAAAQMPRARVVVVPDVGHVLPLEAPDALERHIAAFVDERASARTPPAHAALRRIEGAPC